MSECKMIPECAREFGQIKQALLDIQSTLGDTNAEIKSMRVTLGTANGNKDSIISTVSSNRTSIKNIYWFLAIIPSVTFMAIAVLNYLDNG